MRRTLILVTPLLFLVACMGVAYAQDVTAVAAATNEPPTNLANYLLGLGPVGALIWGGMWMGRLAEKGVTVRVQVDLGDEDRKLLERAVVAIEEEPGHGRRAAR